MSSLGSISSRTPRRATVINQIHNTENDTIEIPQALLFWWNVSMSVFHAFFLIITLSLATPDLSVNVYKTSIWFQVLINGTYITVDDNKPNATNVFRLVPYYERTNGLNITILAASFFALSSLFHFLNAMPLRSFYIRELQHCRTPTRWVEYFFSAPVMFVLIAYGLGIRDRSLLIATATLIATTMPFGYWVEVIARPKTPNEWCLPLHRRIYPWFLGHIPQTVAWSLVILSFYDNSWNVSEIPWFVHVILWAELFLFFSFGAASFVSQLGPPSKFYIGELIFQVLSLVSKGLLGFLLLQNVLMLSEFDEIYEDSV